MDADSELFAGVVRRDREAFGSFYDRWASILFGVCLRILEDAAEAEEVLQEVFLQVWTDAARYDARRVSIRTWLFTIARSRALDRRRSRNGSGRRVAAGERLPEPPGTADSGAGSPLRQHVSRRMGRLTVKERTVLVLAWFEGLTQEEVASRLGEPLGTIKGRARAGLAKLQSLLAGETTDA